MQINFQMTSSLRQVSPKIRFLHIIRLLMLNLNAFYMCVGDYLVWLWLQAANLYLHLE